MKCQICSEPAKTVVIFRKEENQATGYLVLENSVSFDPQQIAKFIYYCESKGLKLRNRGLIDLCGGCLRSVRINLN